MYRLPGKSLYCGGVGEKRWPVDRQLDLHYLGIDRVLRRLGDGGVVTTDLGGRGSGHPEGGRCQKAQNQ